MRPLRVPGIGSRVKQKHQLGSFYLTILPLAGYPGYRSVKPVNIQSEFLLVLLVES